jgi:hypothetical protein
LEDKYGNDRIRRIFIGDSAIILPLEGRIVSMGYEIEATKNPAEYKDQILRLWQEGLPDTPPKRYEWLTTGNPAGRAWWFLALDRQSKALLGFITVLPRHFMVDGEQMLVGIMGDFVVEKRYRGFGPGLKLPRHVLSKAGELGFSLIYTIPYYGTSKHIERAGLFRQKVQLGWLIKPLEFNRYVRNSVAARLLNSVMLLFDVAYLSLFLNPIALRRTCFEDTTVFSPTFDTFCAKLQNRGIIGSRDSRYLTWRYLKNPLHKFHVLSLRRSASEDLLGYVIYRINGGKLDIYDIQYLHGLSRKLLIIKLIWLARREHCESLYLLTSAVDNPLSTLKAFGFIHREEKHHLCYAALDMKTNLDTWQFLQGDRNV